MRTLFAISLFIFTAIPLLANPSTEEVIAKARKFLGGDDVLSRIDSIHYVGEFTTQTGESGTIEIIFAKPLRQRIEVRVGEYVEVTALDGYSAWRKQYRVEDETKWTLQLLDIPKIRELQANTWENLNFFSGIEKRHGTIENLGSEEVDGRKAIQLVFRYPSNINFVRFFDAETGKLLMTRTNDGSEVREKGRMWIDGVLFPERIVMSADQKVLNEISFRKIVLNEQHPESIFAVPSLP